MAKIKRRKLSWQASASPQTIGYKFYWSQEGPVDYGSNSQYLGQVTEIILPDQIPDFKPSTGALEIGLTAVDELGNESDIANLATPFHFMAPEAPTGLTLEPVKKKIAADNILELKDKAVNPHLNSFDSADRSTSNFDSEPANSSNNIFTDPDITLSEEDLEL